MSDKDEVTVSKAYLDALDKAVLDDKPKIMQIIESRRNKLNEITSDFLEAHKKDALTPEDTNYILTKNNSFVDVEYSADDMTLLFEWYKDVSVALQSHALTHYPTRLQFCQVIGISVDTYEKYKFGDDAKMAEIIGRIDNYIEDVVYRMSAQGLIREKTALHYLGSVHGIVPVKRIETTTFEEKVDFDKRRKKMEEMIGKATEKVIEADFEEKEN